MERTVHKKAFIFWFDRIARIFLAGISGILVAKSLGAHDFGRLSYATAISLCLSPITSLGANQFIQAQAKKYNSLHRIHTTIGISLMLQLFGSFLALPFYVGCILLVDDFEIKILIGLLWVCTLIRSGEVNEFWLIGRGETGRSSIASIYSQLTSFTLKTAGVFFGAGIIYYGIVLIIDGLCKSFFFGIEIRKTGISIQKAINKIRLSKSLSYAIRRSTFLAIQSGFVIIYVQSDIVILGSIGEKNLVGIYSILTTLLAAAISLGISKSIKDYNRTKFNNDLETKVYFRETFLISFKLTIAYVIASPLVLHFLGESYSEGYRVIPIIAPLIIMSCMGSALGLTQIDENLEKESMYNTLGGAILNILLNLILIPYLGIIGSGISYTLSSFVAGYIMPRFNKSHKTKSFKHYINPFG